MERSKFWEWLVVAALAVLVPAAWNQFSPTLGHAVSWVWSKLIDHYLIPGWALLIFICLALLVPVGLFGLLWIARDRPDGQDEEALYTSDEMYGVCWEWAWSYGEVVAIEGICPVCACTLTDEQGSIFDSKPMVNFFCQHCHEVKTGVPGVYLSNAHGVISREIIRRLRLKKQAKLANH